MNVTCMASFWVTGMFSSAAAYKYVEHAFLQNFPLQTWKCTALLNSSQWVVGVWGYMEHTLINHVVYVIGQGSFTQFMIGYMTIPTRKFTAYIDVSVPWNIVSLRANYILMVELQ